MINLPKNLIGVFLVLLLGFAPNGLTPWPGPQQGAGGGSSAASLPETVTLGADAAEISQTIEDQAYRVHATILSAGATGNFYAVVNGDTSDTGYTRRIFWGISSATFSAGASAGLLGATVSSGQWVDVYLNVSRIYDGTNTKFVIQFQCGTPGSVSNGTIFKSVSGDVPLSKIAIRAYTATDIGEESYLEFL